MAELTIHLRSHHFVIRQISLRGRPAVLNFAKNYRQFGQVRQPGGRFVNVPIRTYGAATEDRLEFRFHINQLPAFKETLSTFGLVGPLVEYVDDKPLHGVKVDLPVFPKWTTRDYQHPVIEFMDAPTPISKLVAIQTGKGKSYCGMRCISNYGERTAIIIKPMYIDKWIEDITKTYDIKKNELMVVRGGESMQTLLAMAKDGEEIKAKVIIFSNKTFQNYLKLYELHHERFEERGYAYAPDEMWAALGIGFRLIDEVHQDFHLNFKIDLYTNVPKSISLSATLTSNDPFMERMYHIAYPQDWRFAGMEYHKYVGAKAMMYGFQFPNKLRYKNAGKYSHHMFEQSIMKYPKVLDNYLKLIDSEIRSNYLNEREPGQKCLIFCASIDLCTILSNYLAKLYNHLDVRRYVEDDPYENVMEGDIIVSTMLSAGTALDIPNLITVIMTTSMSSKAGNIQGFGRLREIIGVKLRFVYFVCTDIGKQVQYHEEKRVLLRSLALTYREEYHRGLV